MAPLAPALLSTMTGCLRMADIACPMTRAMASLAPPAAVGTTRVMDFSGKAAKALPQAKDAANATVPARRIFWIFNLSTPVDGQKLRGSCLALTECSAFG